MDELKLVFPDLPYAVEEAMNRLRINVKFCGKNTKKIMLTSCLPNEGKSTVAVYLWKMLAEAGFPSVLVDVDLRPDEKCSGGCFGQKGTESLSFRSCGI